MEDIRPCVGREQRFAREEAEGETGCTLLTDCEIILCKRTFAETGIDESQEEVIDSVLEAGVVYYRVCRSHRVVDDMRGAKLVKMLNWRTRSWIIAIVVLVGCLLLAVLLGTISVEESFSSFKSRVIHAASCASTYTDPQSDGTKIVFSKSFANRVFIRFRADNTFTVNIYCLPQVLLTISFTVAVIVFLQLSALAWYVVKVYFRNSTLSGNTEVEDVEENSISRFLLTIPYSHKHLVSAANDFAEEIGRGSFGVVYRGVLVHEGRRRPVAIKKMWIHHRDVNKVFEGEIKRIGLLRHKNVLQLLGYSDTTTSDGDLHLLMVTPLHSSLAKHLGSGNSLPWAVRFTIIVGVAEGLAYLHDGLQQKLVHHDIKPGNILFDMATSQAYIADFGSAKFMEPTHDEVNTMNIVGTSGYMDPHFVKHKIRSTKVDVYSFGVLLFVLVAGGAHHETVSALVDLVKETDVIDPEFSRGPDVSYSRDQVISEKSLYVFVR